MNTNFLADYIKKTESDIELLERQEKMRKKMEKYNASQKVA